jgi:hypothetical protein
VQAMEERYVINYMELGAFDDSDIELGEWRISYKDWL